MVKSESEHAVGCLTKEPYPVSSILKNVTAPLYDMRLDKVTKIFYNSA